MITYLFFNAEKGVVYIRKLLALILCFSLVLSINVFGAGEGNIDSGGGGMGVGNGSNYWNNGDEGVRVSIINADTGSQYGNSIDFTNKYMNVNRFFIKKSKIDYKSGESLQPNTGTYYSYIPSKNMPTIISSTGNNIDAIKKFFCSEGTLMEISEQVGIDYNILVNGKYRLLLEPIGIFTFQGQRYAMTATEVAMYDKLRITNGLDTIRSTLVSFSHKNLPLSMFLERGDLGFSAWEGSTTTAQSNEMIIQYLGLGIVRFTELPPAVDTEVTLRVNTDVITSALLSTSTEINTDSPATVTFNVDGQSYTMSDVVIPAGESQLVWCKWTTPSEPSELNITISSNKGYLDTTNIKVKVVDLNENVPPDPRAEDRNDGFKIPTKPPAYEFGNKMSSASWSVWYCWWYPLWTWIPNWVYVEDGYEDSSTDYWTDADGNEQSSTDYWWVDTSYWEDRGYWKDLGWFEYDADNYSATLTTDFDITPDTYNPTGTENLMKSGYGIECLLETYVSSNAPSSHYTVPQTALTYFPEFLYKDYWRVLEKQGYDFIFKKNKYCTYNSRVHFTPIWYPDTIYDTDRYKVYGRVIDMWTPAGMLSFDDKDSIGIKGTVYDDWHIGPKLLD